MKPSFGGWHHRRPARLFNCAPRITQRSAALAARITLPAGGEFAPCPDIYDVKADRGKSGRRSPRSGKGWCPTHLIQRLDTLCRDTVCSFSHLASCCSS
ncbi:hypothetical protein PBY51_014190 [Eleginops maclovinus]|uniref:Uncharacterized protein n=1 Tax=Eleginops maclovinus TaxID=56733 RepID=A0AAN7WW72_ELEMC|nr:hypothetical protein PBY51_014190 [Eleginops maclovinus]